MLSVKCLTQFSCQFWEVGGTQNQSRRHPESEQEGCLFWRKEDWRRGRRLKAYLCNCAKGFPCGSVVKKAPANAADAGDMSSIPGSGRFPWRRKWQPTTVFLPEKILWTEEPGRPQPMNGVAKSWTQQSNRVHTTVQNKTAFIDHKVHYALHSVHKHGRASGTPIFDG